MTTYLLDTITCIALINGTVTSVRRRFRRVLARESVVLLSSIVAFELWYGVAKSQRQDHNRQRLGRFTSVGHLDEPDFGGCRAGSAAQGCPRPLLRFVAQMCVKPRKSHVSGLRTVAARWEPSL
jgi:predicted nucleic acid-binding protein